MFKIYLSNLSASEATYLKREKTNFEKAAESALEDYINSLSVSEDVSLDESSEKYKLIGEKIIDGTIKSLEDLEQYRKNIK